ncbi:hypothetical protein [Parachitinimonas caeni]|uniref:DUF4426 domain-containing protein n=1 Tax=Parachitinimonas caeni TaxID=3031301 RepID=A0ABT7E3M1_9NEIS|nr:hypothetical protein [Parachitinimonas caeni]MDK2126905.1 hypothetical protein [Parachitinimonas caeni]
MKKLAFLLLSLTGLVGAQSASFDAATGTLVIPEVSVGTQMYNNAKLRLEADGRFTLVSVEQGQTGGSVADTCTASHINLERFNQLQNGISLDQALQIIGCKNDSTLTVRGSMLNSYTWVVASNRSLKITAMFDKADKNLSNKYSYGF